MDSKTRATLPLPKGEMPEGAEEVPYAWHWLLAHPSS